MSDDLKVPGFQVSKLIVDISEAFAAMPDAEKAAQIKKTNGIFQLDVSNDKKETATWTIDLKKTGTIYKGPAKPKADVTIILSDETLNDLATGKLNGQKAFMTGKLKTKGNMMLATKLDGVLKAASNKPKAKL
ncbi:Fatty acid-binding protein [Mycena sanguinolenta]|uniref:Fatty acid-binding protein n=1 Tax=Mycena sanguinolenta TaxID=230812 RepID=A0A8H7DGV6_9AGAR|nr:Fatty acid-binding protein [Mycena sanguinolenta]